jgi:hypothetical protein
MRNLVNIIGSAASGGVSALLPVEQRSWEQVIFQQGKKPVDAEFNLLQHAIGERQRLMLKGLFGSGLAAVPATVDGTSANVATLHNGPSLLPFLIDGRIVLVGDPDNSNKATVSCGSPPGAGTRDDLIFLEVWYEEIQPLGSPEAATATIYKLGGEANSTLTNDLIVIDGVESTRRIQMRWRFRVPTGLDKVTHPNGMDSSGLYARGGQAAPVNSYTFTQDPTDSGVWIAGDGTLTAGQALKTVDGHVYAIPIAWLARSAGVTTIAASALTMLSRVATATNADQIDGFHANATPTAGMLIPLDGTAKFPATVIPSTINADSVDTFHANAAPTASTLLPLDASSKFPNSVLKTGSGQGLDADQVDGYHASTSPAANTLLVLDGSAKFPNSAIRTGSGNGLDADQVDGYHASATPGANVLLVLDSGAKFPNSALKTGSGNGLDADSVDGFHTSTAAGSAAYASKLLVLDGAGKFPNAALKTGAGNGLDADLLDGSHASAFAAAAHSHSVATGLAANSGFIAVGCGNSYTTVLTSIFSVGVAGYHMLSMGVRIDGGTAFDTEWEATIFVDGVEQTTFHNIIDLRRSPVIGWRSSGGLVYLGVGSRTITVRVRTNTSGQTVTVGWARFNVLGLSVS